MCVQLSALCKDFFGFETVTVIEMKKTIRVCVKHERILHSHDAFDNVPLEKYKKRRDKRTLVRSPE